MIKKGQVTPLSSSKGNTMLTLKIMDGHFTDSTWWRDTQELDYSTLLEAVGGKETFCLDAEKGKRWQDFVLSSLPAKVQKKGASHKKYLQVIVYNQPFCKHCSLFFLGGTPVCISCYQEV